MMDNVKSLHGDTPEDELSPEQLYERLQGAKLVSAGLRDRIAELERANEIARKQGAWMVEQFDQMQQDVTGIARDLAQAGGYAHKEKNEFILGAIYRLLNLANWTLNPPRMRDMDDIPF